MTILALSSHLPMRHHPGWIAMFCLGLIACQPAEPIAPNIPDSTQAANSLPPQLQDLQVYFNHNPDNEYTEPYRYAATGQKTN
jgi:hypothetical protein